MSDSPASILYDQDGNPLATDPGTPADKALTVQSDPTAPLAVTEAHPIDVSGLATKANQTAQTTELTAVKTAVDAVAARITNPLPVSGSVSVDTTGLATAAGQGTTNTSLGSIDAKLPTLAAGKVPVAVTFPVTQPVSIAATVPVTSTQLPATLDTGNLRVAVENVVHTIIDSGSITATVDTTGLANQTTLASIDTKTPALVSGKIPVDVGSPAVTVTSTALATGASTAALQGTANTSLASIDSKTPALAAGKVPVDVSFPATQAISAASLPLATGASTAAKQDTGNTSLASIDAKLTNPLPVSGSVTAAISGTPNVAVTSSTLPTGASTAAKQPALGTAGTASADVLTVQGIASMTALKVDGSGATQPITATALPLPTGAASSALQTTGNTSLANIDTKTPALVSGRVPVDGSSVTQPVSAASLPLPSGASTAAKQPALGTAGTPSADVLTVQGAVTMTALKVDGSGATQPVSASSLPLPAGAATSALQTTGNTSLGSIDTKTPALVTGRVPVDGSGVTQPVSGSVTANLGTLNGAATAAKQPALGTAGTAASDVLTVQGIASMTALKVDGSAATQPVSGSVLVTNLPATQAVSAASLPLPTGAATSALQTTGNTSLGSIDGKLPALASGKVPVDVGTPAVSVSNFPATQAVSLASAPLATGAATSAKQDTGNTSLGSIDTKLPALVSGKVPVDVGTPSVTVSNLPGTQPVSGSVAVSNLPTPQPDAVRGTAVFTAVGTVDLPVADRGFSLLRVTLSGTFVASMRVETSMDGISYSFITGADANSGAVAATLSTVGTTGRAIYVMTGHQYVRLSCTSYTSGTLNAQWELTTGNLYSAVAGNPYPVICSVDSTGAIAPAGDVVARAKYQRITDGTNSAVLKAASTAAVAGDVALVVAVSPNNTLNVAGNVNNANQSVNGGLSAAGSGNTLLLNGRTAVQIVLSLSAFSGTITATVSDPSYGTAAYWYDNYPGAGSTYGQWTQGSTYSSATATIYKTVVVPAGAVSISLSCTGYGGGSFGYSISATNAQQALPNLTTAFAKPIKLSDGTNTASVKAGTAAAVADSALVVAKSPNDYATTGTTTSVAGSVTSVQLLAANTARKGYVLVNDSTSACYIKLGTTASNSSYTYYLAGSASGVPYSLDQPITNYTGRIDAIWVTAVGNARITELT